jgi:hypothetical protein
MGKRPVSADVVREVCEDFDLKKVDAMGPFSTSIGEVAGSDGRNQLEVIRQAPSQGKAASTRDMFTGQARPRRWYSVF